VYFREGIDRENPKKRSQQNSLGGAKFQRDNSRKKKKVNCMRIIILRSKSSEEKSGVSGLLRSVGGGALGSGGMPKQGCGVWEGTQIPTGLQKNAGIQREEERRRASPHKLRRDIGEEEKGLCTQITNKQVGVVYRVICERKEQGYQNYERKVVGSGRDKRRSVPGGKRESPDQEGYMSEGDG